MSVLGPAGITVSFVNAALATVYQRFTALSREAGGIIGTNFSTIDQLRVLGVGWFCAGLKWI